MSAPLLDQPDFYSWPRACSNGGMRHYRDGLRPDERRLLTRRVKQLGQDRVCEVMCFSANALARAMAGLPIRTLTAWTIRRGLQAIDDELNENKADSRMAPEPAALAPGSSPTGSRST